MRFAKGDNKEDAPMSSIWLLKRKRLRLDRFWRFAKGDSRHYAPMSPIRL